MKNKKFIKKKKKKKNQKIKSVLGESFCTKRLFSCHYYDDVMSEQPKPRRFVGKKQSEAIRKALAAASGRKKALQSDTVDGSNESLIKTASNGPQDYTNHSTTYLRSKNTIPADILEDKELKAAIGLLPSNYNFEIHKTVWNIRRENATRVALQMPEGLLMFACVIADIIERFCKVTTVVMGDVTYGACCIDDYTARALKCDFLVHYGHSCLVPVDQMPIKTLYVFVDIMVNMEHLLATIKRNFTVGTHMALVSTIQFIATINGIRGDLLESGYRVTIPQTKPLSHGEILGCTAPKLPDDVDCILYIGDGRFHLESIMIANPTVLAYKYDPYSQKLTSEEYAHDEMRGIRQDAIDRARGAKFFGLILGTLGRQGSPRVMKNLERRLRQKGVPFIVVLLSEIFPSKLEQFPQVEAWVQIACPRLSIDWGYAFKVPLLSPFEATIVLDSGKPAWDLSKPYPMDFYSQDALGDYAPNFGRALKQNNNNNLM